MNDRQLYRSPRAFDVAMLGFCLLLASAMLGLYLGLGWHGGFHAAQSVSALIPPLLWESVTTLGDTRVLLALLLPFCLRYPRVFWAIVVASILAGLISRGFKFGLPMDRPAAVLDAAELTVIGWRITSLSFPSGHTASAFAVASIWLALLGWRRALPLLAVACLVGFSRVAVGAHWPMDVLGGALAGTLGAWLGLHLSQHFRWGLRPAVHWSLVGIAVIAVATLPFDGQGYPGSLPWRIAVTIWGMGGVLLHYILPLLRGGWRDARLPIARVWADETKM